MKSIYSTLAGLFLVVLTAFGQTYLEPEKGFRVASFFPEYSAVAAFDVQGNYLYINEGDTIHLLKLDEGIEISKFGKPADYSVAAYASFLTVSPDGKFIWAGFTTYDGSDDRIYSIDTEHGIWKLQARFPWSFDLLFWGDSILVSGINSTVLGAPSAIYVLDTTGQDRHRTVISTGGNSAGMALDSLENLYYGTSYFMDPNAIYRWDSAQIARVVAGMDPDTLKISDGEKLTDLPVGIYDCEVDVAGNLVFNMNMFGSDKVVARWNGTSGDGMNIDTIAVATGESDWLGMLKTMNDFTVPEKGNRILTFSFGQYLADVHTADYLPLVANPVADILILNPSSDTVIDLGNVFSDPDDDNAGIVKTVKSNSNKALLGASVSGDQLTLSYVATKSAGGEAEIVIEGISQGHAVTDTFAVTIETVIGTEDRNRNSVAVYPNPGTGLFQVFVGGVNKAVLKVYNLTGILVHEDLHFSSGSTLDIRSVADGFYMIRIITGGEEVSMLVSKQ